jgi:hypothetical protein
LGPAGTDESGRLAQDRRSDVCTGRQGGLGDARIPYLEKYGAKNNMPMRYDFKGEIIPGTNEPLHTWEVFYWTAR